MGKRHLQHCNCSVLIEVGRACAAGKEGNTGDVDREWGAPGVARRYEPRVLPELLATQNERKVEKRVTTNVACADWETVGTFNGWRGRSILDEFDKLWKDDERLSGSHGNVPRAIGMVRVLFTVPHVGWNGSS